MTAGLDVPPANTRHVWRPWAMMPIERCWKRCHSSVTSRDGEGSPKACVKSQGLCTKSRSQEVPPYSSYTPKDGGRSPSRRKSAAPESERFASGLDLYNTTCYASILECPEGCR